MAQTDDVSWGTDTPISLPVPPTEDVLVDLGGFGFTQYGITHNVTKGNLEAYIPTYLPDIRNR